VQAGGGGTAVLAAPVSTVDADETGPSTSQTVTGLVLAGAAAVAVAVRSSRRRRRTDSD
jgi:LPXTG-motif cell wall-anchored protein